MIPPSSTVLCISCLPSRAYRLTQTVPGIELCPSGTIGASADDFSIWFFSLLS